MRFENAYARLPDGWLSEPEARMLWELLPMTEGPILEVGCYKGRSTCLLAATGRPVYAVDPFAGFSTEDPTGEATAREFLHNMALREFTNVTLFPESIETWEPRPVGLAYLDGDHTYQGTAVQIKQALRCQPSVIAIHDVNDSGGGLAVRECAEQRLGPFTGRVERLAWWKQKE
jgi:hypothetical protein